MSQLKKVFLKPASVKKRNSSDKVFRIMKRYKRMNTEKSLEKGYKEMALINLSLAEMFLEADNDTLRQYEEKLTECE